MGARHEDARKHDLLAAILAAKEQGIGGNPYASMAYHGRYNGGAFIKTVIDAPDAPLSPSSFVTFSTSPTGEIPVYITSVFIGYIGTDSIGSFIKRFAAKKPEKDVEINNQRKAFLICWRGRSGTDNGRQKTRNHGYDVIVEGGELFTDYSDHLANLSSLLNPKLKSTGADGYQLLSCQGCHNG